MSDTFDWDALDFETQQQLIQAFGPEVQPDPWRAQPINEDGTPVADTPYDPNRGGVADTLAGDGNLLDPRTGTLVDVTTPTSPNFGGTQPGVTTGPNGQILTPGGQSGPVAPVESEADRRARMEREERQREQAAALQRNRTSARATLRALYQTWFDPEDVASLDAWSWDSLVSDKSNPEILLELRGRAEYKKRFPGMEMLRAAGKPLIDEATYIDYERTTEQLMATYQMPKGFYDDRKDIGRMMAAGLSTVRIERRLRDGFSRVMTADADVRSTFREWFGPEGDTALAMFFIDPERSETFLMEAVQTGVLGGIGRRHDVRINQGKAAQLAGMDISDAQAEDRFSWINKVGSLFQETVSENRDLTKEVEGVDAAFSLDSEAQEFLDRRLEERVATSQGGGGATFGRTGTGFGSARS